MPARARIEAVRPLVAILADGPSEATSRRLDRRIRHLAGIGYEARVFDLGTVRDFEEILPCAEAAILIRMPAWPSVAQALVQAKRLGDGEGAWISDPEEADGRFRSLYRRNRRSILHTWFGSDALLDRDDFLALRERFLAVVPTATVVGVTYPERVKTEYDAASPDGVPCCGNVLRHVLPWLSGEAPFVCSHDVHLDLHLSGSLHRLMTSGCPVGLISCHPELAAAIGRMPGLRVAAALLVPEEKRFAPVIGETGIRGAHYPEAFGRTMARIRRRDWRGVLWLVAAGYLGKLYCHEIAICGGVAVDIGSIADGWCGKATRPGLADLARYRLGTA